MKIRYNVNDWQGYPIHGAGLAVNRLNRKLETKINTALKDIAENTLIDPVRCANSIRDEMYVEMAKESQYGLNDTEPRTVIIDFIERGLGLKPNSMNRWDK